MAYSLKTIPVNFDSHLDFVQFLRDLIKPDCKIKKLNFQEFKIGKNLPVYGDVGLLLLAIRLNSSLEQVDLRNVANIPKDNKEKIKPVEVANVQEVLVQCVTFFKKFEGEAYVDKNKEAKPRINKKQLKIKIDPFSMNEKITGEDLKTRPKLIDEMIKQFIAERQKPDYNQEFEKYYLTALTDAENEFKKILESEKNQVPQEVQRRKSEPNLPTLEGIKQPESRRRKSEPIPDKSPQKVESGRVSPELLYKRREEARKRAKAEIAKQTKSLEAFIRDKEREKDKPKPL